MATDLTPEDRRELRGMAARYPALPSGGLIHLLDALEAAEAERDALREALQPFAAYSAEVDGDPSARQLADGTPLGLCPHLWHSIVRLGDCRRAAVLLKGGQHGK